MYSLFDDNNVVFMSISLMVDIKELYSNACMFLDSQPDDHVPDRSDNGEQWIRKRYE
jgi:hypothetical protein